MGSDVVDGQPPNPNFAYCEKFPPSVDKTGNIGLVALCMWSERETSTCKRNRAIQVDLNNPGDRTMFSESNSPSQFSRPRLRRPSREGKRLLLAR